MNDQVKTDTGYQYNGQNFNNETRTDSQGNKYSVAIPVSSVMNTTAQPQFQTPAPQAPTNYGSITTDLASQQDFALQQFQNQQERDLSDTSQLQNALMGESAFKAQQSEASGLNAANQAAIQKAAEISALGKQAAAAQQENISQGRQLGSVGSFVAGQGAEIERNRAIKALSLGAELDAIQGNIAVAQSKVDQAVEAQYAPMKQALANKLQMFELNKTLYSQMSDREQKLYTRAQTAAEKEQKKLDQQIADKKDVQNMIIEATPNAPATIIATAKKLADSGASKLEVAQALGEYAGDYWGTKLKIAQINKTEAEIQKAKADAAETRAKITAAGGVGSEKSVDTQTQAKFLLDTIAEASNLSSASGRSKARRGAEAYTVGATDYTNLESKVRTVKNNLLTLATDPNIKKFFGPQMTDSDVRNMLSAATTLDTEGQTPDQLKEELNRVNGIFQKFAPDYTPTVKAKQDAPSWASSIKDALLNPSQGGTYGFTDNKKQ
jgi:hypothetical protein